MKLPAFFPTSFSLSASLTVAFGVFLAPVAMLLVMFLQQQQRDIDFAKKEIRGVQMAIEVKKAGLSVDEAVYRTKLTGALTSSLFTTAADLRRAEQLYGKDFEIADTVDQVSETMMDIAAAGSLSNTEAAPIASKVRSLLAWNS